MFSRWLEFTITDQSDAMPENSGKRKRDWMRMSTKWSMRETLPDSMTVFLWYGWWRRRNSSCRRFRPPQQQRHHHVDDAFKERAPAEASSAPQTEATLLDMKSWRSRSSPSCALR